MSVGHLLEFHDFILELLWHFLVAHQVATGKVRSTHIHAYVTCVLSLDVGTIAGVITPDLTLFLSRNGLHRVGCMGRLHSQMVSLVGRWLGHVPLLTRAQAKAILVRLRS